MLDAPLAFWRFSRGLGRFFEETLSGPSAHRMLAQSLESRATQFLHVLRHGIFAHEKSPYLPLLRDAQASYDDLERIVLRDGVEAALRHLYQAGVSISVDAFKGKEPIVRGSVHTAVSASAFDNPLIDPHFTLLSGGTGGTRRRLNIDLALLVYEAAMQHAFLEAHGLLGRPLALWRPAPPGSSGLKHALRSARLGAPIARWFDLNAATHKPNWRWRLLLRGALWQASRHGDAIPSPIGVPIDRPAPVAEWLASTVAAGEPGILCCPASAAVRVSDHASARRLRLDGVVFWMGGEPITSARCAAVERVGARAVNGWSLSETGPLAIGCPHRVHSDEVHLIHSKVAVLGIPSADRAPNQALLLTTILPAAPKLLLNVDSGDLGILGARSCGCPLEVAGFTTHLSQIHSAAKCSAGGMHILGSDLAQLVERVLPAACGGSPLHYQFIEKSENGKPLLCLRISPQVGHVDSPSAIEAVVHYLRRQSHGDAMMVDHLVAGGMLRVERAEPKPTPAGKLPALWVTPAS